MLKLIYIIIGLCVIANITNAQYNQRWSSPSCIDPYNDLIGCANTDADAAKEVVYLSGQLFVITVIDGLTGTVEWTLNPPFHYIKYDGPASPQLIDVDSDDRYEILFCGRPTASDSFRWYLYGYGGSSIKQEGEPQVNLYQEISIGQSRPNPVTSITTIDYSLTQKAKVLMKIYNSTGQLIRTLLEGEKDPGKYTINWDSRDNNGVKVANGSYFYQLEINDQKKAKRMVLVK